MNLTEEGEEIVELPEYFSTHPSNEHRSQDLEKLMPEALRLREDCNCYELKAFEGMLNKQQKKLKKGWNMTNNWLCIFYWIFFYNKLE